MNKIIITTTNSIDGYKIKNYFGVVCGRKFVDEITLTTDKEKCHDESRSALNAAEQQLKDEAARMGANAVIGVSVQFAKARAATLIVMTGTAVEIE